MDQDGKTMTFGPGSYLAAGSGLFTLISGKLKQSKIFEKIATSNIFNVLNSTRNNYAGPGMWSNRR